MQFRGPRQSPPELPCQARAVPLSTRFRSPTHRQTPSPESPPSPTPLVIKQRRRVSSATASAEPAEPAEPAFLPACQARRVGITRLLSFQYCHYSRPKPRHGNLGENEKRQMQMQVRATQARNSLVQPRTASPCLALPCRALPCPARVSRPFVLRSTAVRALHGPRRLCLTNTRRPPSATALAATVIPSTASRTSWAFCRRDIHVRQDPGNGAENLQRVLSSDRPPTPPRYLARAVISPPRLCAPVFPRRAQLGSRIGAPSLSHGSSTPVGARVSLPWQSNVMRGRVPARAGLFRGKRCWTTLCFVRIRRVKNVLHH